jgi:large subunit ribosomal protein L24
MHASNVQVVCSNCGKHTRISHNTLSDGSRVRACKRCGTTLDK